MKISGKTIFKRLKPLTVIENRLSRIRHFHGHGVHSPFVYYFVRKVLMTKHLIDGNPDLYTTLENIRISKKRSRQLSNAMIYCGCKTYSIDSFEGDFVILSSKTDEDQLQNCYDICHAKGKVLIIMEPYRTRKRNGICRALILSHSSTSIDNRAFVLFMNNDLPKQHYIL